jgi:hypothetical protein
MIRNEYDDDRQYRDFREILWSPRSLWILGPVTGMFILYNAVQFGWLPSPMLQAMERNTAALSTVAKLTADAQKTLADAQNSIAKSSESREARLDSLAKSLETIGKGLRKVCRQNAKIMKSSDYNEQCDDL